MNLFEISNHLGGQLPPGSHELTVPITGASSLEDAGPADIVFYEHPRYLNALRTTKAGLALVPMDFDESVATVLLRVEQPSAAFTVILEKLSPTLAEIPEPGIHPTAIVAPDAQIDPTASIQPYAIIERQVKIGPRSVIGAHSFVGSGSEIGEDCLIYPQVVIRERTILGARVIIHSSAVIGSDGFGFQYSKGAHRKVPQNGNVQIDDDVEIGACTTIDRARFGRTWIQEGTKIDNLVQIAHNVVIGPQCLIIAQTGIAGSARLGRNVILAGQAGVTGHVTIGDEVVVSAKSGVSKDTPAKEHLFGMIGMPVKEARELLAQYRRLPKTVSRIKALETEVAELRAMLESRNGA